MNDNKIGIYHYFSCNATSLKSSMAQASIESEVSNDFNSLKKFKKIIIPGIGNMQHIYNGLKPEEFSKKIQEYIDDGGIVYGICLGMQYFLSKSEEGDCKTLDLITGSSVSLKKNFKMTMNVGFKKIKFDKQVEVLSNLFDGISENAKFYFLHKYHCIIDEEKLEKSHCIFEGKKITSAFYKKNILGTQFHPELSGHSGLKFLKNFFEYKF